MKQFICYVLLLLLSISCEQEEVIKPKDSLFVITDVLNVYNEGAEFSAHLVNLSNQEVLTYGFVWSEKSNPTIQDNNKLFNEELKEDFFSYNVKLGLVKEQTYYVRAYIVTDKIKVYGTEKSFLSQGSSPPKIINFEPKYGPIGTKVIIEGGNFIQSKTGNIVKFGDINVAVNSYSENQLLITIPEISKPEKVQITIETAGMVVTSQDSFDLWFPWKRMNDFNEGYVEIYPVSFTLNNKGYFGLGYNETDFWEYDPVKDLFIKKADFPKSIGAYPISFTANNLGYVLFIDNEYRPVGSWTYNDTINELWEYNPENDLWTRKADFPGAKRSYGVALSINDKGYIVGGKYWDQSWDYYPKDLWEYDPLRDEWTQKADFPGSDRARSFGFSMNGKGYFGIGSTGWSQKSIYEYNPDTDTWTYYSEYPGEGYNNIKGFIINGKCYLGLGRENSDDSYSDFWEFNIENKTWKELHSCPINMAANLIFTINNKGYIGLGWNDYYDYSKILYEFDPAKN